MRVPGQKFFVPANKKTIAGMARSYKCTRLIPYAFSNTAIDSTCEVCGNMFITPADFNT